MLFIKGTPAEPRCGFSSKIVALLNETGVKYTTFDILSDEDVRQGLKTYSNWPTFPQLYINGELIGGLVGICCCCCCCCCVLLKGLLHDHISDVPCAKTGHCQGDEGKWRVGVNAAKVIQDAK